ncbi:major histocompatibility complex class I-related gene protein-like isoform X2 [Chiloscyllium plagiosum]|uniref:major histocompatibility complex class I-related gene protein-like isoform X2 n=1 Tax=Chiloscyllium plagiosum TaxID=36176 RepID=UPI001CB7FEB9|nr:major histocompatibility complex class I-related gene protein-like isoform X2 [Chiloscyllium plagiosum]
MHNVQNVANFHILTFYYVLSLGQAELPEYSLVAMLDDHHIVYFDSTLEWCVPRQQWMAQSFPKDHWTMMTITMAGLHGLVKGNIEIFYQQHRGGSGLFFVQGMCGCELHSDNSTDGFIKLGYNGQDAFVFDKDAMSWIAFNPEFQALADRLNLHTFMNKYFKTLLEKDCVKWLQIYLEFGRAALQRRGFYPGAIEVTWLRNEVVVLEVESSDVLPHQDETYRVTKTMEVSRDGGERYSCHVEHASLMRELNVPWERMSDGGIKLETMIRATAISLTLLVIIIGIGFWRKRWGDQPDSDKQVHSEH